MNKVNELEITYFGWHITRVCVMREHGKHEYTRQSYIRWVRAVAIQLVAVRRQFPFPVTIKYIP
jgi:hypothetical protein